MNLIFRQQLSAFTENAPWIAFERNWRIEDMMFLVVDNIQQCRSSLSEHNTLRTATTALSDESAL